MHRQIILATALGCAFGFSLTGCNTGKREDPTKKTSTAAATTSGSGAAATSSGATTQPALVTLTINAQGSGTGTIVLEPPSPSGTYPFGTAVTLRALPDAGSSFRGWGGDLKAERGHERLLTMQSDLTIAPTFDIPNAGTPVANFTVGPDPAMGMGPLSVTFSDASTGTVGRYEWTFGDGKGSVDPSPVHVFNQPGTYTVSLRVYDAQGDEGLEDVRFGTVYVAARSEGSRFWYQNDRYKNPMKENSAGDAPLAQQVLDLVNQERATAGVAPVAADKDAERAAQAHTSDMINRQYFDHMSPEGFGPDDRFTATGATNLKLGENIAQAADPAAAMQAWMNSPGHRANILDPDFTHLGVGVDSIGGTWTQVFIKK
ncbi:MAG: CAP domain-containing protein [Planctomycetota bacterium]